MTKEELTRLKNLCNQPEQFCTGFECFSCEECSYNEDLGMQARIDMPGLIDEVETLQYAIEQWKKEELSWAEISKKFELKLKTLKFAMTQSISYAGHPDASEGCRLTIKILKEALEAIK